MKVILTGATGLVGGESLRQSLVRPDVTQVVSIGRRKSGVSNPKLTELAHEDFLDFRPVAEHFRGADLCIYCLATYSHKVSRSDYETITVGFLSAFIDALAAESPNSAFCFFSSQGTRADGRSWMRALNVKGRAEEVVLNSVFPRRYVFRPGYIHPTQPREKPMFMDTMFAPFFRIFPFIGVEAAELARVMLQTGVSDARETAVLENSDMRTALARP